MEILSLYSVLKMNVYTKLKYVLICGLECSCNSSKAEFKLKLVFTRHLLLFSHFAQKFNLFDHFFI